MHDQYIDHSARLDVAYIIVGLGKKEQTFFTNNFPSF